MIKPSVIGVSLLLAIYSFSFQNEFTDSMSNVAGSMPPEEGVEFMLDNFYSVYSKNYEDGISWGEMTLNYAVSLKNDQYIGRAKLALGTIWYLRGDYEKSIAYYQEALSIFESLEDEAWMGRTHNQMSVYARKQKQFEKGLEHLDKSFDLCTNAQDLECLETSLNNRGVIHEMMGDYPSALLYYRRAEKIAIQTNNDLGLSYIYNNLAECHRLMENFDSVAYYVELSTKIRFELEDFTGVAMNYANLGEMFTLAGEFEQAEEYLNKAIELTQEIQYLDLERHSYELMFRLKKQTGVIDEALLYLDKSLAIKDSILGVEKIKSLSEMEVRYETEKVEKEFAEEQQHRTEAELKVSNRNNWIIGISGGLVAMLFTGLYLYTRRMKKVEAEKSAAVLSEKQKGLQAVFDATEEERQRIARDLHDGVGQQMSGLKLAWENLSVEIQSEKIPELSKILDETAQEVRDISHQMMPKVLNEFGLIPAIKEMLDKSFSLTSVKYQFEHFNIKDRFPVKTELALYRVAQELVNNVIKHSDADKVDVQLFKNKDALLLIVEDNGVGISNLPSEGHGMITMKTRLETVNGDLSIEAGQKSGTIATVRINLNIS